SQIFRVDKWGLIARLKLPRIAHAPEAVAVGHIHGVLNSCHILIIRVIRNSGIGGRVVSMVAIYADGYCVVLHKLVRTLRQVLIVGRTVGVSEWTVFGANTRQTICT